ncbi:hypothetical protein TNCV_5046981 [Trichonephila clavipes]|nr:hypothetical protein TNCV_5046981 [Trichonephila clavipes]
MISHTCSIGDRSGDLTGQEVTCNHSAEHVVLQQRCEVHKTLGPTDLTSTYSLCTWRVFGGMGIEPRPSSPESGALTTRLPMVPEDALNRIVSVKFFSRHSTVVQNYKVIPE